MRVGTVTVRQIEDWWLAKTADGTGYWARRQAFHTLQHMLSVATRKRHIDWNPTTAFDLPDPPRRVARDHLTLREYRSVLAACASSEELLWVRLAGEAGLRRGEIAALRRRCVDVDLGEIVVEASIAHVTGAGVVERPPKSGSARIVAIGPSLSAAIAEYAEHEQLHAEDRLFRSPFDGGPVRPDTMTSRTRKLVARAGLRRDDGSPRFSLHDLRRTAATLAREAGVDVEVIRDQLGHGHVQMTTKHYIRARANPRLNEFATAIDRLIQTRDGTTETFEQ